MGRKIAGFWYYGKKLVWFLISLWVLSVAVFYLSRLAPGDPLGPYYGERAGGEDEARGAYLGKRKVRA